jgi:indolepyruvate ferredoxin oxidoreductase
MGDAIATNMFLLGFAYQRGWLPVSAERRTERALISEYEATVERLLAKLSAENHALAVQIASLPEEIRGFGHIKMRNLDAARKKHAELLSSFDSQQPARAAA